ncbi:MAG: saccharopine dehydrogenase (NAD+, L-lysine-forming) [Rickettsiales bacterium]|jgi:saccharopine dehydrogenase (NAD+, L-lysine-forming)
MFRAPRLWGSLHYRAFYFKERGMFRAPRLWGSLHYRAFYFKERGMFRAPRLWGSPLLIIKSFKMTNLLIIGAGAAGSVVAQKCAMNRDVFSKIHLASRTISKCEIIKSQCKSDITISQIDADIVPDLVALINQEKPDLVINMALPYQDLTIMDACLETGVNYIDTANYEPKDEAKFHYGWQWAYQERFKDKGLFALLGSGFDPGVTNVFCAYAQKNLFDEIHHIDIIDCNDGDHGKSFATNFNTEINIREVTQKGKYWENGKWIEIDALSINQEIDFPEVGIRKGYLIYHEELESLAKNIKGLKSIKFWMTFSDNYIKHLDVLQSVGMTRIDEVEYQGQKIIPLQFLAALLPAPSSLAEGYTGKTSIGCIIEGIRDGKKKKVLIYNVCDHASTNNEVKAQAVSYTTGVPAATSAIMVAKNIWGGKGVFNIEQMDPDPFLEELDKQGLPWKVKEIK